MKALRLLTLCMTLLALAGQGVSAAQLFPVGHMQMGFAQQAAGPGVVKQLPPMSEDRCMPGMYQDYGGGPTAQSSQSGTHIPCPDCKTGTHCQCPYLVGAVAAILPSPVQSSVSPYSDTLVLSRVPGGLWRPPTRI